MAATVPIGMVEPRRRRIRHLRRGETGYAVFTALKANGQGRCFLQGDDWLYADDSFDKIRISRDEKGFNVVVPSDVQVMRLKGPDRLVFFFSLIRVASVTVGYPRSEKIAAGWTSKERQ